MKAKEVLRLLKITRPTLCSYLKKGYIDGYQKDNGQYEYDSNSVYKYLNKHKTRLNVIYARVSTSKQKNDLSNQINFIESYMIKNGTSVDKVYSDVSSGMNYDRKEFQSLLNDVIEYKINTVFISYKDRFGRTAYNALERLFNSYGTKIVPISSIDVTKNTEKEFLEEIVSLIHSFSMKMYSSRRKKKLNLIKDELQLEAELKDF